MGSRSPEVVVIGAGIIGLSIAWRLAQAGVSVRIIDASVAGSEASWAGAGMLAPGGELEERSALAEFALESLRAYPGFMAELEQESGASIDFQRLGAVDVAFDDSEWDRLSGRVRKQEALGIRAERLDEAAIRAAVPLAAPAAARGYFYPDDALVHPRQVVDALRTAVARRGIVLDEFRRVLAVRCGGPNIVVDTISGAIEAASAVIAAGAWSSHIEVVAGGEPHPLESSFPVRGHLLGYRLPAGSLGPILRHGHTYIVQRANGLTVAGSSAERVGFERSIDPSVVRDIESRALPLLPELAKAGPPNPWNGFRPATASLAPEIGRVGDTRVWLAYGHYRNGILLAPATASRIAALIMSSSQTDSHARRARQQ